MEQAIATFISLLDARIKSYESSIQSDRAAKQFERAAYYEAKLSALKDARQDYDICVENAVN